MKSLCLSILLLASLAGLPAHAQHPDRSQPPKLGPPPALTLKPVQHLKLSNGLHVLLYEKHEVPLVHLDLVVKTGAVQDPAGKGGLASMTAALMMEGAGSRNALELADAIDFLGAQLILHGFREIPKYFDAANNPAGVVANRRHRHLHGDARA